MALALIADRDDEATMMALRDWIDEQRSLPPSEIVTIRGRKVNTATKQHWHWWIQAGMATSVLDTLWNHTTGPHRDPRSATDLRKIPFMSVRDLTGMTWEEVAEYPYMNAARRRSLAAWLRRNKLKLKDD
jgi:hypothetical protein